MTRLDHPARLPDFIVFAVCLILAAAPLAVFGPAVIDDAYITFRYAENLASGKGFVFNVSDGPILGTSTPLFTVFLALGRILGMSTPGLALTLSVLGAGLTFFSGVALMRRTGGTRWPILAGLGWAAVLTTAPQWVFTLQSGMETMLFVGLAMSALATLASGRNLAASALAGLTVLTRYDGWALAAIVLAWTAWKSRRKAWPSLVVFAAVQVPWVVYALTTFGSYLPHSVEAKRIIQPRLCSENLLAHLRFFAGNLEGVPTAPFNLYLLPLFLLGLGFLLARRSGALALPVWGLVSVLGFSASRILIQNWYLTPPLAAFSWVAVWGTWRLCGLRIADCGLRNEETEPREDKPLSEIPDPQSESRNPQSNLCIHASWLLPTLVVAFLLSVHLRATLPDRHGWPRKLVHREQKYLEAARWVREHAPPGSSVLVGEVGALAWALPQYRIIDSSGINSDRVLQARRADRRRIEESGLALRIPDSGTPEWVRETIREERPDYLVSIDALLHLETLSKEAWFNAAYEQKEILRVLIGDRVVSRISIHARRESDPAQRSRASTTQSE